MNVSRDAERYAAIAAIVLLVIGCYLVLRPFLTAFLWGGIISISTRGFYTRLAALLGGRRGVAAALTGATLAAVLLLPIATLGLSLASRLPALTERFVELSAGGVPRPPAWVADLPLVGASASGYWDALATDPQRIARDLRPLLKPVREFLVAFSAGIGSGVLEFVLALLIAPLLYVWGEALGTVLNEVARRLGGEFGQRQVVVVASTVRGVFNGVLGTATVQALLSMIGFWAAGVPGVFFLGIGTFFLSVVPGGPALLWLPAAIWLHLQGAPGWAIFMALWGLVVVSGSDNIVRPLLIGQGVRAPIALVFLGVIGGVLAFGFLGLFIGPTVLAVALNLLQEWLATRTAISVEPGAGEG
jgi:predicted PurR-regulated permease PerM